MNKFRQALIVFVAGVIFPYTASADLIQQIIVFDLVEGGETVEEFPGGLSFGTLIFPNEFQNPFGDNPSCSFGGGDLPQCETGQFIADRDAFPGFNDLNGTGIEIPDSLDLFGFWSINDEWEVDDIFAWTRFNLGDIGDGFNQLTLVFGRGGNICANFNPDVTFGGCFNDADSSLFAYQLNPSHAVPEPGTLALFALGLLGLGVRQRRQSLRSR